MVGKLLTMMIITERL